jgi:hypothetical protein
LKVKSDVLTHFSAGGSAPRAPNGDKAYLSAHQAAKTALPLHRIYVMKWGKLGLRPLLGSEGLRAFLEAATYRGELIALMGRSASHAVQSLELLRRVPFWELSRPRELARIGEVVRLVSRDTRP